MLRHIYSPVNETIKGLFPLCNLGAGMLLLNGNRVCVCLRRRYAL